MAGIIISNLPAAPTVTTSDIFPIVQNGTTYKANVSQILPSYGSEIAWTPAATFATPGDLTVAYSSQIGIYTRIGSLLFFSFQLIFTPTYTTAAGVFRITGIPFNINSFSIGSILNTAPITFPAGTTALTFSTNSTNSTFLVVNAYGAASAVATFSVTELPTGVAAGFIGSGFYYL